MSSIILPPKWRAPERQITPESVYHNRREFLKVLGAAGMGIAGACYASPAWSATRLFDLDDFLEDPHLKTDFKKIDNLKRNAAYTAGRPVSEEEKALTYNNFYEFTSAKDGVWKLVEQFKPRPWKLEIAGHVEHPAVYEIDDLIRAMPIEERVYRHRCVERWAMVVPWNGFPMKALIDKVRPTHKAKYVRFVSFLDPEVAPGQKNNFQLPWPYTEGLTLAEAMNELTFLSTGIYGHIQPAQHGAPIRLVTPWKYGYKSIKSIVKIEFVETRPRTFWNTLAPHEYGFVSNVDPDVPHPRWSQKFEKMIGTGEVFPTQKFNGYGEWVSSLYT